MGEEVGRKLWKRGRVKSPGATVFKYADGNASRGKQARNRTGSNSRCDNIRTSRKICGTTTVKVTVSVHLALQVQVQGGVAPLASGLLRQ